MVRKANKNDIGSIMQLLHQVNMVHYGIRPDLFKPHTTKYTEPELEALLADDSMPVFVYEVEDTAQPLILGHAFCQVSEVKGHTLLQDTKTLYIDDICVDAAARGKHVGTALYNRVLDYARSIGCHNVTLNVWEGNDPASAFYRRMGMHTQKTTMEVVL